MPPSILLFKLQVSCAISSKCHYIVNSRYFYTVIFGGLPSPRVGSHFQLFASSFTLVMCPAGSGLVSISAVPSAEDLPERFLGQMAASVTCYTMQPTAARVWSHVMTY